MTLEQFETPAGLRDLSEQGRVRWSSHVNQLVQDQVNGDPEDKDEPPRPQFFNPLGVSESPAQSTHPIPWGAFPKNLKNEPSPGRWTTAEERDNQDEYCEWVGECDEKTGDLTRVIFTTELRCYFHLLADDDPEQLLAVYRKHVSPRVQLPDLIRPSTGYDERNRWNLAGAMHMIQQFNKLSAAIILTAQASILRERDDKPLENASDLIDCGVVADPGRNSDPKIVGEVNKLARQRKQVSLADPLGLYIHGVDTQTWRTPDGVDAETFWTVTRGDKEHAVRAEFVVPAERGYGIKDIKINDQPISSPSQVAEDVTIRIVGISRKFEGPPVTARSCSIGEGILGPGEGGAGVAADEPRTVEELMAASNTR